MVVAPNYRCKVLKAERASTRSFGVASAERLVKEEELWFPHKGAAQSPPAAAARRRVLRVAVEQALHLERCGDSRDAGSPLGRRQPGGLQGEEPVLADGHVRVERIALEDHGDVPSRRGLSGDVFAADGDPPSREGRIPCDRPQ